MIPRVPCRPRFVRPLIALTISASFQVNADDDLAVVVTATRIPTQVNAVIADVTVIEREAIEKAGPTTLPTLLSRQPGLHVTENGGPGKVASVFIRGTSSSHTLVLVDGVPLGSATVGLPTLNNLPLSQIERIEILRGPASSLYGADAIGGVIQVFTRRGKGPAALNAYVGAGSRGTGELQVGVSGSSGPLSYSLSAAHFQTRGFNVAADPSRFRTVNFSSPNPDADGYRNTSYAARFTWELAKGHELGLNVFEGKSRNHFDSGGIAVDAFSNDRTEVQGVFLRNRITDTWTSELRFGTSLDRFESFDPNRSLFATRQNKWSWQNDLRLPVGRLLLAAENTEQKVDSTTAYTVSKREIKSLVLGYQGNVGPHSWQTALRRDDNSQFGQRTTGSLGYGYRFTTDWQVRASTGTAFKAPSFNELYFPDFGNANLRPEKSRNNEVGLHFDNGHRRGSLTYFDNRITDLIAGFPVGNIGRARITGTSLAYGVMHGNWSGSAAFDLMKPIDEATGNRLQRRPAQLVKFAFGYTQPEWTAGAELQAVGRRYDTVSQTRVMGGYSLLNLHASRQLGRDWALEARLNNVFDRRYETAWSFAVPGREMFVGVRYTPK